MIVSVSSTTVHPNSFKYMSVLSCKLVHTEKVSLFLAAANIVSSILLAYFFLDSASSFYFLWSLEFGGICCNYIITGKALETSHSNDPFLFPDSWPLYQIALVFLWILCSLLPFFGSYLLKPVFYLPVMCSHVVGSILGVFFSVPCLVSYLRFKQNLASGCSATNVTLLLLGSLLSVLFFLEYFQTVRYLEDLLKFSQATVRQRVISV